MRSKSSKSSKSDETSSVVARTSSGPKSLLERRWSQVSSQVTTFRKNKKRNSCAPSLTQESNSKTDDDQSDNGINEDIKSENISVESAEKKDSEYVKISKAEYEEIKYRVTEIERRISLELENPDGKLLIVKQLNTVENVQDAYEQTLEQAEPLSPTTDHLARRLSRELKIRRSAEQKIIRSPSARKIGTIRRRSRDQEKQNVKTNQYRCVSESDADSRAGTEDENREVGSKNQYENIESLSKSTARSSSFHGESRINQKTQVRRHSNCPSESENWRNGQVFFRNSQTPLNSAENGRSSLAKLRTQNAGMVLAKAKIFNELLDSVNTRKDTPTYYPRVRLSKTGTLRYNDRCSYRVRMLKADDKKPLKKSVMSPRRKTSKSPNAIRSSRLQVVKNGYSVPKDDDFSENKENKNTNTNLRHKTVIDTTTPSPVCVTPKSIPHIKRPLSVKASKKLTRTPLSTDSRLTPFKVMASARQNY